MCELLKHDARNVFRSSVFSSLVCATLIHICRVGMEADEQYTDLPEFLWIMWINLEKILFSLFEHGSDFIPMSLVFRITFAG